MFVGHYGVAFGAKPSTPVVPLWAYFIAVQWLDVVWSILVLCGVEKLHIIPGHDTDALTNPFEADMGWTIKLDKEDFVGRAALVRAGKQPLKQRLVGFEMLDGIVPGEGDAVVAGGLPIGRVTSAKRSPTLGHTIGLAWVPPAMAVAGAEIQIQCDGRLTAGHVVLRPFYDPDGGRLRG